jgi:hypothetical protein
MSLQKSLLAVGQLPACHHSEAELKHAPYYSFVIPLFRTGKEGLNHLVKSFHLLSIQESWELVLVDDGSDDDTASIARELRHDLSGRVILVELARNYGEHAAVLEGLRHASGCYIATLDDDLQTPPSEALRLLSELRTSKAEVIYGKPMMKQHAMWRNLGSKLVNKVSTWIIHKPGQLYLSSFRVMRRELLIRLVNHTAPQFHLDAIILQSTNRIEQRMASHSPRRTGNSGYTLTKLIKLTMVLCMGYSTQPLRWFVAVNLVLTLFGVGYFTFESIGHSMHSLEGGFSLLWLALFMGSQLMVIGLLGEYVGRLMTLAGGMPQCCVRSVTFVEKNADQ